MGNDRMAPYTFYSWIGRTRSSLVTWRAVSNIQVLRVTLAPARTSLGGGWNRECGAGMLFHAGPEACASKALSHLAMGSSSKRWQHSLDEEWQVTTPGLGYLLTRHRVGSTALPSSGPILAAARAGGWARQGGVGVLA